MAKYCKWCGEQVGKIGFVEIEYDVIETMNKNYCVCKACSKKIQAVNKDKFPLETIRTNKTDPELFNHYAKQGNAPKEMLQQEKTKKASQQTNLLYEDIHQIAGDLRFIKNYLIFCIIVGIISCFIWVVSML